MEGAGHLLMGRFPFPPGYWPQYPSHSDDKFQHVYLCELGQVTWPSPILSLLIWKIRLIIPSTEGLLGGLKMTHLRCLQQRRHSTMEVTIFTAVYLMPWDIHIMFLRRKNILCFWEEKTYYEKHNIHIMFLRRKKKRSKNKLVFQCTHTADGGDAKQK